jgi:hypothetical protein
LDVESDVEGEGVGVASVAVEVSTVSGVGEKVGTNVAVGVTAAVSVGEAPQEPRPTRIRGAQTSKIPSLSVDRTRPLRCFFERATVLGFDLFLWLNEIPRPKDSFFNQDLCTELENSHCTP